MFLLKKFKVPKLVSLTNQLGESLKSLQICLEKENSSRTKKRKTKLTKSKLGLNRKNQN